MLTDFVGICLRQDWRICTKETSLHSKHSLYFRTLHYFVFCAIIKHIVLLHSLDQVKFTSNIPILSRCYIYDILVTIYIIHEYVSGLDQNYIYLDLKF